MSDMQLLIFMSLEGEHMEGKQTGVAQDLLFLYIVFNWVMGSFACFWSLFHYRCKWAQCDN